MSYILEALKLSEQTRRPEAAGLRFSLLPPASEAEAEPAWPWRRHLLAAALLVNAAVIALWLRPIRPQAAAVAAPTPAVPAAQPAPPLPVVQIEPPPPVAKVVVGRPAPSLTAAPVVAAQPAAAASPPPVVAGPAPAKAAEPLSADGLPASLQKLLPPLAVGGSIRGEDGSTLVIVNDKLFSEGDEVAPGLKLEKILDTGVVFNFRGHRFRR